MATTMCVWMKGLYDNGPLPKIEDFNACLTSIFWLRVLILALPYFMYYYIWHRPKQWNEFFNGKGVEMFSVFCPLFKILQISMVANMRFQTYNLFELVPLVLNKLMFQLEYHEMGYLVCFTIVSQFLNVGVYRAIGSVGVYNGVKMGHVVPWVHGFPFSLGIRHSQYNGACIAFAGWLPLWWSESTLSEGLLPLHFCWYIMYLCMMGMEEGNDPHLTDQTDAPISQLLQKFEQNFKKFNTTMKVQLTKVKSVKNLVLNSSPLNSPTKHNSGFTDADTDADSPVGRRGVKKTD